MYAKLFSRIAQSSLMEEKVTTRYVFMMMLAIADRHGDVIGTDIAIARTMNVTPDEFSNSVKPLLSPDPASNSQAEEGRRLVPSENGRGYRIVNYPAYRDMKSDEEKREYMRNYMRDRRSGKGSVKSVKSVNICKTQLSDVTHTEADTDTEEVPPNPQGGNGQELFGEASIDQKDRYLPKDWRKLTKADQKKTKVMRNSQGMNQIGAWFGRRPETLWTIAEAASLLMIKPSQSEIDGMGTYYQARISADDDIRRRDLGTLLNNWSGELDRARKFVNSQAA